MSIRSVIFDFSNDWKNGWKSFQWLENPAVFFPMIVKILTKVSNDWNFFGSKLWRSPIRMALVTRRIER